MRVVDATAPVAPRRIVSPRLARTANVEMLGLAACSVVVLLGLFLTYWGRTTRAAGELPGTTPVNLHAVKDASELEPLLTTFQDPAERQAVARALAARASSAPPLEHVGGLASVTLPAAEVRRDGRLVELNARLARRPQLTNVAALSAADLAALKPRVAVRTFEQFRRRVAVLALWFLAAFWAAHVVRRVRRRHDDPILLPALMALTGLGLMSMLSLRDPLRDMLIGASFVQGVVGGLALLVALGEIDFEAWPLRRAVLLPLGAAVALAVALLAFGSGPGTSGAKVNLLGFQPVEAVRLLVVFALAAYFSRRLDVLRELATPVVGTHPWVRRLTAPRWRDVQPILVSMAVVLTFFFLQRDLGPALVMACVFLSLYGIARGRATLVVLGLGLLVCGFATAYAIGFPATVRQRVTIWMDPWNNGLAGGNQIAHGVWALATGSVWGLGQGLGQPQAIPAGHTDFVLAAIGEELGFVGVVVVAGLYVLVCWRALRVAMRAPGDYTALLGAGLALALIVQAFVIAGGLLGLVPLAGVVTPFLSFGRSSMLANFAAVGVLLAISRRAGPVRAHLQRPLRLTGTVLATIALVLIGRVAWIQGPRADLYAAAPSLSEQADGAARFEYNPRLLAAARTIPRGTIYDRNGLALATSAPDEIAAMPDTYRKAGIEPAATCTKEAARCYPLGGMAFHVLGDWVTQANWGARNSSYIERDRAAQLQGFDDHAQVVEVVHAASGTKDRIVRRDYSELLPLARDRFGREPAAVQALLKRERNIRTSIDARLQLKSAAALKRRVDSGAHGKGSLVALDAATGDVLASVSYPWPESSDGEGTVDVESDDGAVDAYLDRSRYALYAPGSVFKLVVAGAAMRHRIDDTFACVRLPDGRVGNFVRGASRPVRDDLLDHEPHGSVDLHKGLVVSCNAYFAQLALKLGPDPIVDAARLFQIDASRGRTAAALRPTLPHAGYGQGEVLVSPVKMARVAASIASGGAVRPARWETSAAPPDAEAERFLSAADAARLSRHMRDVVTSGTGRTLQGIQPAIAGKTGTAEVTGSPSHSWFVGFAPFAGDGRRIAFAVIVENAGYGSRTAAPIAGDLVTAAQQSGLFRQ